MLPITANLVTRTRSVSQSRVHRQKAALCVAEISRFTELSHSLGWMTRDSVTSIQFFLGSKLSAAFLGCNSMHNERGLKGLLPNRNDRESSALSLRKGGRRPGEGK